jgi:hypothetical protein
MFVERIDVSSRYMPVAAVRHIGMSFLLEAWRG